MSVGVQVGVQAAPFGAAWQCLHGAGLAVAPVQQAALAAEHLGLHHVDAVGWHEAERGIVDPVEPPQIAEGHLRALADAVVVGAGTVAADNPQLTTRLVSGPSPLRVVFDPERRLASTYRVFTDGSAPMDRTNWSDTVVSYYLHGGAIALALDMSLLDRSEGRATLDDFMRRRSKIDLVVDRSDIVSSPGLREVAEILFGDDAERRLADYLAQHR